MVKDFVKERLRKERAEYEEKLKVIFDSAAVAIFIADTKTGRLFDANKAAQKLVGRTRKELLLMHQSELHPSEKSKEYQKLFRTHTKNEYPIFDVDVITKKGKIIPVIISSSNGKIGNTDVVIGSFFNVTERKKIEEKLIESENKFRTITNSVTVGILAADPKTKKFVFVNSTICKMFGYSENELLGSNVSKIHPKKDLPFVLKQFELQRKGKIKIAENIPVLRKNKELIYCDISSSPEKLNNQEVLLGIFMDVTKQKKAEEKLKESEEKYKTLYESSRDALMILEPPTWKFTAGNPATLKMFGAKNELAFTSKSPSEYSPNRQPHGELSSKEVKQMIQIAMKKGSHFFEWTHRRINGKEFPATVLLTKIKLHGKSVLQATVRDITEEKKVEEKLREFAAKLDEKNLKLKEANKITNQFASIAAHELKIPSNIILNDIKLLFKEHSNGMSSKVKNKMKHILENAKHLQATIQDTLILTRAELRGNLLLENFNLNNLITNIVKQGMIPIAQKKNIELTLDLKGIIHINADKNKITEVINNLLDNAIKFTNKNGKIEIKTLKKGSIVMIKIIDNGLGIAKKNLPHLFTKFFRVNKKIEGTGLGLVTCKELIKLHGGKIGIISKLGKGSTIWFSLPIKKVNERKLKKDSC